MNRPLIHIETDWPNTWQRSSPPSGQPRCQHLKSTDPPPLTLQVERQSLINSLLTVCLYASEFFFCESISVRSVRQTLLHAGFILHSFWHQSRVFEHLLDIIARKSNFRLPSVISSVMKFNNNYRQMGRRVRLPVNTLR